MVLSEAQSRRAVDIGQYSIYHSQRSNDRARLWKENQQLQQPQHHSLSDRSNDSNNMGLRLARSSAPSSANRRLSLSQDSMLVTDSPALGSALKGTEKEQGTMNLGKQIRFWKVFMQTEKEKQMQGSRDTDTKVLMMETILGKFQANNPHPQTHSSIPRANNNEQSIVQDASLTPLRTTTESKISLRQSKSQHRDEQISIPWIEPQHIPTTSTMNLDKSLNVSQIRRNLLGFFEDAGVNRSFNNTRIDLDVSFKTDASDLAYSTSSFQNAAHDFTSGIEQNFKSHQDFSFHSQEASAPFSIIKKTINFTDIDPYWHGDLESYSDSDSESDSEIDVYIGSRTKPLALIRDLDDDDLALVLNEKSQVQIPEEAVDLECIGSFVKPYNKSKNKMRMNESYEDDQNDVIPINVDILEDASEAFITTRNMALYHLRIKFEENQKQVTNERNAFMMNPLRNPQYPAQNYKNTDTIHESVRDIYEKLRQRQNQTRQVYAARVEHIEREEQKAKQLELEKLEKLSQLEAAKEDTRRREAELRAERLEQERILKEKQDALQLAKKLEEKKLLEQKIQLEEKQRTEEEKIKQKENELQETEMNTMLGSFLGRQEAVRLEIKMKALEAASEQFRSNSSQSRIRLILKKRINTAINQIAASQKQVMNKVNDLHSLLSEAMAQQIPGCAEFCIYNLAERLVMEGEGQISLHAQSSFPVAFVMRLLEDQYDSKYGSSIGGISLKEAYLAVFYRRCPMLVPRYVPHRKGVSMEEYRKECGYKNDKETEDQFNERMSGLVSLFAAYVQTTIPSSSGAGLISSIHLGWTWLARLCNMKPRRATPCLMISFFDIAGFEMANRYGKQFQKLLIVIAKHVLPNLPKNTPPGPTTRLRLFGEEYFNTGRIEPPKGKYLPETDAENW